MVSVSLAVPSVFAAEQVPVGAAVVDVTPDYPIRMVGYESRKTESEGIGSRLKVRALAIGADGEADGGPAVLVAVDNCAVGAKVTEEVAARLNRAAKLPRDRFVVCSTHTHCAPALSSGLDFIFSGPLPADQWSRIERYTRELTDAIEKAALDALAARVPANLAWGQGRVGFAANRRVLKDGRWVNFGVNPNGPVDHSLPVLRATDANGKVKAVLFGYACHCTTLGGEFNKICAEWTGYACDEIEKEVARRARAGDHWLRCGRQSGAEAQPRRRQSARSGRRTRGQPLGHVGSHSPARPDPDPHAEDRASARTAPCTREARGSNQGVWSRRIPRTNFDRAAQPRRITPHHSAVRRTDMVLRRRDGDGVPRGRSRR